MGQVGEPSNVHNCTNDDTNQCTNESEAFPEQAEHNCRTECCTEYAPSICYKAHNGTSVRTCCDYYRNNGDCYYYQTTNPKHFVVGSFVVANDGFINVTCERGSCCQKLAVSSTHGSRQYCGKQKTGHQSRENGANHGDEYQGVIVDVFIKAQVHTTNNTNDACENQNGSSPSYANDCRFFHVFLFAQGHEANDNVGHTKVAKTPA